MYRVSEVYSSGAGTVSGAAGGAVTGCCSGCGIAEDMTEVVDTEREVSVSAYTINSWQNDQTLRPTSVPSMYVSTTLSSTQHSW